MDPTESKILEDLDKELEKEERKRKTDDEPTNNQTRGKNVVCTHFIKGTCRKGSACEFLHENDKERMPECKFYFLYGHCNNGDACQFKHTHKSERIHECPFYQKGFCKNGNNCKHSHTPKKLCTNYLYGFCPDGPECEFYHPKSVINDADDKLETLANLLPSKRSYSNMKHISQICHKCADVGHCFQNCPLKPYETRPQSFDNN